MQAKRKIAKKKKKINNMEKKNEMKANCCQ